MNTKVSFFEKLRYRLKAVEHKYLQYRLSTNETTITETEYGKVKGAKRMTIYDKPYYSFEGIPYAQPPIGELRFKAPQRPTPWTDIKDCFNAKDKPTQVHYIFDKVDGSEDCLHLNVYTNNVTPDKPRPVLVWIHGGGFQLGEANRETHGPDYFMEKDVVLVTIQYRLSVLGFLSLETPELNVPGNAGLKDQVLALKWIKNNCASFGGNPDCITVFGESAGGASTHYMMLTQQTQGLFHRAVLMSGNALAPWAETACAKRAFTVAKLAGYKGENNDRDVLQFLQKAKAKDLVRVVDKVLTPEEVKQDVMFAFGPTIEPFETPECVIPKSPREMLKTSWSNSIPVLMGCTSFEGLLWTPFIKQMPSAVKQLDTCVDLVPYELCDAERKSEETKALGLKLKAVHVKGGAPTADEFMHLCSIKYFWFPLYRLVLARFAHAASAPIFLYRFDFDSEELINPYRLMRWGRGVKGVAHADELTYLFWNLMARRVPKESREYRTIERAVGLWTKFAESGKPYDEQISGMDTICWDALSKSDTTYKCLNISDDLRFIDLPETEQLKVWESLYEGKRELLY